MRSTRETHSSPVFTSFQELTSFPAQGQARQTNFSSVVKARLRARARLVLRGYENNEILWNKETRCINSGPDTLSAFLLGRKIFTTTFNIAKVLAMCAFREARLRCINEQRLFAADKAQRDGSLAISQQGAG